MKKTPISRAFIAIASFFIAMPLVACASDLPSGISSVEDTHISSFVEDVSYSVSIEGGVEEGTTVKADELTDGQREAALGLITEENVDTGSDTYVFDISLFKDGVEVQPSGKVKVTIAIPGIDLAKSYTVFHIKDGGTYEKITPVVEEGKVTFETSGFSTFIIAPNAGGSEESSSSLPPKAEVLVSINILPLAECGTLKVNGVVMEGAASYKTTHYEGDVLTVEALPASGKHFKHWADDNVISKDIVYEFTVGTKDIAFSAVFTKGHEVSYIDITEEGHTEKCDYCSYSVTVPHTYSIETIEEEATCLKEGWKELACVCGKAVSESIPLADHAWEDGACSVCGEIQNYLRCDITGVANAEGAYIKMGKIFADKVSDRSVLANLEMMRDNPWLSNFEGWTPFDFGAGDTDSTYYRDFVYQNQRYRCVCIKSYRLDNDGKQSANYYDYSETYWFSERSAMWRIIRVNDGKAYLVSKNIWISQRFAESDTGELTYQNSWIRSWIQTWQYELLNESQRALLQPNEDCFGDKIFIPSSEEISINNPIGYGGFRYPACLGAFYDSLQGYGETYGPYWLRDLISVGEDGKNYVDCVSSRPPFDETAKYLANKTYVGVVPGIIIQL